MVVMGCSTWRLASSLALHLCSTLFPSRPMDCLAGPIHGDTPSSFFYKNGMRLLESYWFLQKGIVNGDIDVGVTGSRIVVRTDIVIYSKGRGQAKSMIF